MTAESPRPSGEHAEAASIRLQFTVDSTPASENVRDPEILEAVRWYEKELAALPEMKVTTVPLESEGYTPTQTSEGRLNTLNSDRGFLKVVGAHTERKPGTNDNGLTWNQPLIEQTGVEMQTATGEKVMVSGIVLILEDPQGRRFVTVEQEPGEPTVIVDGKEKHPAVRTVQTSIGKLNGMNDSTKSEEQRRALDPTLYPIRETLSNYTLDLRRSGSGGQVRGNVHFGLISLSQKQADALIEAVPHGKFLTEKQLSVLPLNDHTHVASDIVRQRRAR